MELYFVQLTHWLITDDLLLFVLYCVEIILIYFDCLQLSEITADLAEENTTSQNASELLEAESSERMRLEKENKDIQVNWLTV